MENICAIVMTTVSSQEEAAKIARALFIAVARSLRKDPRLLQEVGDLGFKDF